MLIDRIREHYGGGRGALSQFARDIGQDPRTVFNWVALNRPIPSIYAPDVEAVTRGTVTARQVEDEDRAYLRARADARAVRKAKRIAARRPL